MTILVEYLQEWSPKSAGFLVSMSPVAHSHKQTELTPSAEAQKHKCRLILSQLECTAVAK